MVIIKQNEMSTFDRYKYIKLLEIKEEYQKHGDTHRFIESLMIKDRKIEYNYLSIYSKTIYKDNKIYNVHIYEIYNDYCLEINLKHFLGFNEFPDDAEIEKFIDEFIEVAHVTNN